MYKYIVYMYNRVYNDVLYIYINKLYTVLTRPEIRITQQ